MRFKRYFYFYLILLCLSRCTPETETKEYFQSGNLKSLEKALTNEIRSKTYFWDEESKVPQVEVVSKQDTIIEIKFFSENGNLMYKSSIKNISYEVESTVGSLNVLITDENFQYLSLAPSQDILYQNFAKFDSELLRGKKSSITVPKDFLSRSNENAILFLEEIMESADGAVIIQAAHCYINLNGD